MEEKTLYQYKQDKKQKRREARLARRQARKDKRERRKFERLSKAKYRWHQRLIVKFLRIGGPITGFAYAGYKLMKSLFGELQTDVMVGQMDLKVAAMLLVGGTVLFGFALYFGFKWIKTAITANAVARNQGEPSLHYSPVVITMIRFVLSAWLFGLLILFNHIGVNYGESLNTAFEQSFIAYALGFGILLAGDMYEQSILKSIKNKKHKAKHETEMAVYDLTHNVDE